MNNTQIAAATLLLLALSGWLGLIERIALGLTSDELKRLTRRDPGAAARIARLRAQPRASMAAIWLALAAVEVTLAAALLALAGTQLAGRAQWLAAGGALLLWLVFRGHTLPSRLSSARAVGLARHSARGALLLTRALVPLALPLQRLIEGALRRLGVAGPRSLTEEEFLTGIEVGEAQGVLRDEESGMVEGILGLENTQASEVMTPRVDLIGVALDASTEAWVQVAGSVRFRHLPVYRSTIDTVEGMLDIVRFLLDPTHDRQAHIAPPMFVSEASPLHELLVTFQRRGLRNAVVLDEYGGTAGLITRGDILEEITADVTGEYAPEPPPIQALGDGSWLVDGATSLEDLNDELELRLSAEGADRIAGWAFEQGGKLLRQGEQVLAQGCRATVHRMHKHRILQLRVERLDVDNRPNPPTDGPERGSEDRS